MTIGQSMKAVRERRKMSRAELAEKALVCEGTIKTMENDKNAPSLYTAMQCAKILGVTLDEYVGM